MKSRAGSRPGFLPEAARPSPLFKKKQTHIHALQLRKGLKSSHHSGLPEKRYRFFSKQVFNLKSI
jgi:hypothetical protein